MKNTLQRRTNMCDFLLPFMGLIVIFMMYAFILKPINRRYEAALNHRLGKEIARSIYQKIHPEFSYKPYVIDDTSQKVLYDETMQEFEKLLHNNSKTIF